MIYGVMDYVAFETTQSNNEKLLRINSIAKCFLIVSSICKQIPKGKNAFALSEQHEDEQNVYIWKLEKNE